ncbi:hypothetical protein PoB_000347000 [Plakobranchus ocellatus]|uniref:Uncharacterized protein n=1 Tax=Plakobranchus ocellatus TaxID=259542 RepID=A0AAV3Y263_9GAST|nr:hypothetical protein PoB_000347000 [Plakobranchus ocellatus]
MDSGKIYMLEKCVGKGEVLGKDTRYKSMLARGQHGADERWIQERYTFLRSVLEKVRCWEKTQGIKVCWPGGNMGCRRKMDSGKIYMLEKCVGKDLTLHHITISIAPPTFDTVSGDWADRDLAEASISACISVSNIFSPHQSISTLSPPPEKGPEVTRDFR